MQDLTQGPIGRHVVAMALPIAIGLIVQTLYFLVDLYFVARLGDAAIAGVSAAGNVMFIVMALTQMLGVGTAALISHAVGRQDAEDANRVFNQSLLIAAACALLVLAAGYAWGPAYMGRLGADAATIAAGGEYLNWYLPGLAAQFALVAMSAALRGTGVVQPTMVVQLATVLLNVVLAPILIAGVFTHRPLGVAGAGLASSLSVTVGIVLLSGYFLRLEKYVGFRRSLLAPRLQVWRRIFAIGLPAGGEFALMFVYMALIFAIIRGFGADAQAGFGVGQRVMQALFLPAMALAFACAPIVGQNYAAGHAARVRATFATSAIYGSVLMLGLTLLSQWRADWLIGHFTDNPRVIAVGGDFLRIISFNFIASGLIFTCSSVFQGLGNTWPSLFSSATRLVTFAVPALLLSLRPGFRLVDVWHLSVATVALQAALSLLLVRREFGLRLTALTPPAAREPLPD